MRKDDLAEKIINGETVVRFFQKCIALDNTLVSMGKKPVAMKTAHKYIKPFQPVSEQARTAKSLETVVDGLRIAFKALKGTESR